MSAAVAFGVARWAEVGCGLLGFPFVALSEDSAKPVVRRYADEFDDRNGVGSASKEV